MTGHGPRIGGEVAVTVPRLLDVRWALRRALLGLIIMAIGVGSLAWLTHASIDPALESPQTSALQRSPSP